MNLFQNLFIAISICFASICHAQQDWVSGLPNITPEQAENYVGFLADDLLEGRDAGTRGSRIAAGYIVSLLKDWGVTPLYSAGFYQPFDIYCGTKPTRTSWTIDSVAIENVKRQPAYGHRKLHNILAMIPGKITDECIVIGAHYDHDGINEDIEGDCIYNGADDNASGVSAVLQIAKAVKSTGKQPLRTIILAFWDGEEKGALGSQYFVSTLPSQLSVKGYINFDMIGRGPIDNPQHLTYFYTAAYPMFERWLRKDMEKYNFAFTPDYRAWESPTEGSDNAPFARAGIPIVWYHTEGHSDYHRPSDSAEKIDYKKLTDITRAAYLCALRMANTDDL